MNESESMTKLDLALVVLTIAAIAFCVVAGWMAMTTPMGSR